MPKFASAAGWMVPKVLAHSIDYIATDIQPQAIFTGQSGHFRVIDPVAPGSTITFNLTFELVESSGGPTTVFPATVTFGVQNTGGGLDADAVKFGTPTTTLTSTIVHTYEKVGSKTTALMTPVTAYAPNMPGSYHFKIAAIDGVKGRGLTPGDGIVIHFKVAESAAPIETVLSVSLNTPDIVYKTPTTTLLARLTEKNSGNAVPGQSIRFSFNGATVGTVDTDANGTASFTYASDLLKVGDYVVAANYQGAGNYVSSSGSATQCVRYDWRGYLPPVLVQDSATSGLGIGLFQGKVIPVKVKIADYYGGPVPSSSPRAVGDPELRVYFAHTIAGAAEVQAIAIQPTIADSGNLMRYDAAADQYILNWNISGLGNGDYNIRVGAEEGACAVGHWSPVRIGKASK